MHPRHDRPCKHSDSQIAVQSRFGRGAVSQRSPLRAGADAGVLHPAAADQEEDEGSEVLGPRMRAVWLVRPCPRLRRSTSTNELPLSLTILSQHEP